MFFFPAIYLVSFIFRTSYWIVYKTTTGIYYLYKNHNVKLIKDKEPNINHKKKDTIELNNIVKLESSNIIYLD